MGNGVRYSFVCGIAIGVGRVNGAYNLFRFQDGSKDLTLYAILLK